MKRPSITDFFPEATTPADLQKLFSTNPELYRFIQALDGYIDYLEEEKAKPHTIQTSFGGIPIREDKSLGPNEIRITKTGKP